MEMQLDLMQLKHRKSGGKWEFLGSSDSVTEPAWTQPEEQGAEMLKHLVFMSCSLCFSPCVSIIPSVWVFQETQLWQPPDSHLDHFPLQHQKEKDPAGGRKWCIFPWCKSYHPTQLQVTTTLMSSMERREEVLSGAWLSRWESIPATTNSTILHIPLCTHLQKPSQIWSLLSRDISEKTEKEGNNYRTVW